MVLLRFSWSQCITHEATFHGIFINYIELKEHSEVVLDQTGIAERPSTKMARQ